MIQLDDENNFACNLRDKIKANIDHFKVQGVVHTSLIKKALDRIEIPKEYYGHIRQMTEYRKFDRITDWIEQLIEGVMIRQIVKELIDENIGTPQP